MEIELDEDEKGYLERKAEEYGCTEEEFLHNLMGRDMETDCRYLYLDDDKGPSCMITEDTCVRFIARPAWLNGHVCEVATDHEYDIATVERKRM